jgi:hypothetical protein
MSNTKFTRGDWESNYFTVKSNGKVVADCGFSDLLIDAEEKANVHLIAAAPDMYAMIKELSHELNMAIDECNEYLSKAITSSTENEPDYIDKQTVHEAQLLLKKARGE